MSGEPFHMPDSYYIQPEPDEWDEDTAADRYQQAHDQAAREDTAEGWQPRQAWVTPGEPVCPVCSYLIVDGRCVKGCTQ